MRYAILLTALLPSMSTHADAQRWMMHGGYGWGTYRYWGPWGRPGGYYYPGQYRWNGVSPWAHRNYY